MLGEAAACTQNHVAERSSDPLQLHIIPLLNWNETAAIVRQLTLTPCKPRLMAPAEGEATATGPHTRMWDGAQWHLLH